MRIILLLRLLLPLVLHGIFDGATGGSSLLLREIPTCPYFQLYCDVVIDGDGYQRAKLNEVSSFDIVIGHRDLASREFPNFPPLLANGTVLQARLKGPAIVTVDIEELALFNNSIGIFKATYELRDPGEYRLQIRLVWLTGASSAYDPFINEVEFDHKSKYIDCTIYNESISVVGTVDPVLYTPKPFCTDGTHAGSIVFTS